MKILFPAFLSISFLFSCNNYSEPEAETKDTLQALLTLMRDSVRNNPGKPEYSLRLAETLKDAGQYGAAIKVMDSLINAPGNFTPPRTVIGWMSIKASLLELAGDTVNEIRTLEQIVRPGENSENGQRLGYLYAETKNPNTLPLCDAMIKGDESGVDPVPDYIKGVYYANTGDLEKAIGQFDKSIKKDYTFLDAYMEKGRVLYNKDEYKEAIRVYDLLLQVSNSFADAFLWKAMCQQKLGMTEEARLNYQKAYALDRTLTEARDALEKL